MRAAAIFQLSSPRDRSGTTINATAVPTKVATDKKINNYINTQVTENLKGLAKLT